MSKHTVFILQEKQSAIDELTKILTSADFEVIGSSCYGNKAVEAVAESKPDFLILGIISFCLDGLEVMARVKEMKVNTKCIVISSITREEIIQKAFEEGAYYYFAKPLDEKVLVDRLLGFMKKEQVAEVKSFSGEIKKSVSLDEKISKIFISVGIPPHIKGYTYLREGIKMAVKTPEVINNITKKLYPSIGEKYQTSASKVERAIRHAIEVAWNRGRIDSINSIFGVRAYVGSEKPTNGEFIALVADKMILEGA